ncbi:hypothetical protein BDV95DRAFT_658089 [Massariosphaeria phaeospora]|uniref:Uncharacterized protein n=1 Tax=Massariosphaeria phaeospora TaxID=100035 RepID=A0A7C8MSV9_9PLEO|nr:hypothetical protein BDV95DRAFT_658089 [Massariosphaeria phaeospora]
MGSFRLYRQERRERAKALVQVEDKSAKLAATKPSMIAVDKLMKDMARENFSRENSPDKIQSDVEDGHLAEKDSKDSSSADPQADSTIPSIPKAQKKKQLSNAEKRRRRKARQEAAKETKPAQHQLSNEREHQLQAVQAVEVRSLMKGLGSSTNNRDINPNSPPEEIEHTKVYTKALHDHKSDPQLESPSPTLSTALPARKIHKQRFRIETTQRMEQASSNIKQLTHELNAIVAAKQGVGQEAFQFSASSDEPVRDHPLEFEFGSRSASTMSLDNQERSSMSRSQRFSSFVKSVDGANTTFTFKTPVPKRQQLQVEIEPEVAHEKDKPSPCSTLFVLGPTRPPMVEVTEALDCHVRHHFVLHLATGRPMNKTTAKLTAWAITEYRAMCRAKNRHELVKRFWTPMDICHETNLERGLILYRTNSSAEPIHDPLDGDFVEASLSEVDATESQPIDFLRDNSDLPDLSDGSSDSEEYSDLYINTGKVTGGIIDTKEAVGGGIAQNSNGSVMAVNDDLAEESTLELTLQNTSPLFKDRHDLSEDDMSEKDYELQDTFLSDLYAGTDNFQADIEALDEQEPETFEDPPTTPLEDDTPTSDLSTWALELHQTLLGTQSLFQFLTALPTNAANKATKQQIATAFLSLHNAERAITGNLGSPLVRQLSVTALVKSDVAMSMVIVGSVSLYAFMAMVEFDGDGMALESEVYGAFKRAAAQDKAAMAQASSGRFLDLACRMGKL